jgi:ribosome biogenesis GTPase / thiamine phosphate phosphatase
MKGVPQRSSAHNEAKRADSATDLTWQVGLVIATHGRHCVVQSPPNATGEHRICHPRGKKSQVLVGDLVQWQASTDEGTIEQVQTRRNAFYRQDELRTKAFAANLDHILILIAAEPEFSEKQLARALIAAEQQQIKPIIVLNKSDLTEAFTRAWARMQAYQRMCYDVLPLCLVDSETQRRKKMSAFEADKGRADDAAGACPQIQESFELDQLKAKLQGKTTLVLGPSGSGKSTLVNALIPGAQVLTGEISQALNSGKHTTTSTNLYWVNEGSALIDSPGFQEFGLQHIAATDLAALMPDFKTHMGQCRFYNCTHLHEPGCGVTPHLGESIVRERYRIYQELFAELSAPPRY